jgi:antitoxin component YwqK of YwqJK toxin-antitoxin module
MYLIKEKILLIVIFQFIMVQLSLSQKYEIYKSDTINKIDDLSRKQGRWITFFEKTKKIEAEGYYENNAKSGVWKTWYQNGNLKTGITYMNNQPNGHARIYYENGKISEEGNWKNTVWIGSYTYYHSNGQKAYEWNFTENGKRSGPQKYYYENGKLYIKGDWVDGKENGTITEYNEDGTIKSEKNYTAGQFEEKNSKFYSENRVKISEIASDTTTVVTKTTVENNNNENAYQTFDGNGHHQLYNAFKKIDREGEFKNGRLIDGKRYYYNSDGNLLKTVIYEDGNEIETIKEKQK